MRVLVTGSNGLLGSKLLAVLIARPDLTPIATSRGPCANSPLGEFAFYPLDTTDQHAVERVFTTARPDVVIHTAAMTDVDGCERDPRAAWTVNVDGAERIALACGRSDVPLVHLSTEYVFDGRAGPYAEDASPNPISVYGKTKLASEQAVAASCRHWSVARTTVVFGFAPWVRANFVLWLVDRLSQGQTARIVSDQIGSPTLADNLAEMVLALATRGGRGIYHTVGASRLSRYEFARLAAAEFGLDVNLVEPITTAELNQPAPRPLRAGLLVDRLRSAYPDLPVLSAADALAELHRQLRAAGRWPSAGEGAPP